MSAIPDSGVPAVEGLLPHTGCALLLTRIVRSAPDFLEATGRVPSSHPLVNAGTAPCFLGLELGAQAAAALAALARRSANAGNAGGIGYLVRVREAAFLRPHLPTDTPLRVTARLEGAVPPLSIHRIRVSIDDVDFVRATLGTHSGAR